MFIRKMRGIISAEIVREGFVVMLVQFLNFGAELDFVGHILVLAMYIAFILFIRMYYLKSKHF